MSFFTEARLAIEETIAQGVSVLGPPENQPDLDVTTAFVLAETIVEAAKGRAISEFGDNSLTKTEKRVISHGVSTVAGSVIQLARIFPGEDTEPYIRALTSPETQVELFDPLTRSMAAVAIRLEEKFGLILAKSIRPAEVPVEYIDAGYNASPHFAVPWYERHTAEMASILGREYPFRANITPLCGAFARKFQEIGALDAFLAQSY